MKNWRKLMSVLLMLALSLSLVACSGDSASSASSALSSSESSTNVNETESEESSELSEESSATTAIETTPREETLYVFVGQWGKVNDINPFSSGSNSYAIGMSDASSELLYETLYMYNQLDGKLYPLLADGDYTWNDDQTELTVKIKAAAAWSDGTSVTAEDVAYSYNCHVKYQSNIGIDFSQYIDSVTATDDSTVVFKAKADNHNPLKMLEYLPKVFVCQKAYLETIEKKVNENSEAFKTDTMFDAPHSGPYNWTLATEEKVVLTRNESYWGQDASMWGELPAPKYIVHNIYSGNDTAAVAFENGEIDVNQQFISNVWKYWEDKGLPISTYLDESPYYLSASMPTAWFNVTREGIDQKAVRQAIAYAVDYDQIIASAMSGYSPSFMDVPRSLFNPTASEQAIYASIAPELEELQWTGKEIDRAKKVLDDAGIVDSDGDGIREYNGKNLSFKCECPTGWTDWNAALEIVAAAGKEIGIELETYFPETTVWTEDMQTGNFDIIMNSASGAGISNPWQRAYQSMYGWGGDIPERITVGYSRYYNKDVDAALAEIPTCTDQTRLNELYVVINKAYLEDVPNFSLMYRPQFFHEVNESVWSGFPEATDGNNIPPTDCIYGYGVASLYEISLVK